MSKKEDLSVNSYINKYGGIPMGDGTVVTTKHAYNEHLKRNDLHVKDYKVDRTAIKRDNDRMISDNIRRAVEEASKIINK